MTYEHRLGGETSRSVSSSIELTDSIHGGLNINRTMLMVVDGVHTSVMQRTPRDELSRAKTFDSITAEYEGIGAFSNGVELSLRGMEEQAAFMNSAAAVGLNVPECVHVDANSLVTHFIRGIPLNKYVQKEGQSEWQVIGDVLSHMTQAHSLGIVFGDRWTPNTLITNDGQFVEIDFDLELKGEFEATSSFELAQTLFHLLHFAGSNRDEVLEAIKNNYVSRPELLSIYSRDKLITFLEGHTNHFGKKYQEHKELYEGQIPPVAEVQSLIGILNSIFDVLSQGDPTNSHSTTDFQEVSSAEAIGSFSVMDVAQSLAEKYHPQKVDNQAHQDRYDYLSHAIVPSETFAYEGQGARLKTNRGELIDMASMTVNCILGQNDPWVNANLIAYLLSGRPSFLTTRLGSDLYYSSANRILGLAGFEDGAINHRQSNGTDVTELAVAAAYRNRQEGQTHLVSFEGSYHGQGLTAYHSSGLLTHHRFLTPDSPVIFLGKPSNVDNLHEDGPLTDNDADILQELEDAADKVFGVMIEPIQVNNAVNMPGKSFMHKLYEICQAKKISLIYDEVQTGVGWLGQMTASQVHGIRPDLLALSKALTAGNGPLSALISDKRYQDIPEGTASKTNGADIRSLVAAHAVLDRLFGVPQDLIPPNLPDNLAEELGQGLIADFDSKSEVLARHMRELQVGSRGLVRAIKGQGLIRGAEIADSSGSPNPEMTKRIQQTALDEGVLVRNSGHTLIVKPPIVINETQLDEAFGKLIKIIRRYA